MPAVSQIGIRGTRSSREMPTSSVQNISNVISPEIRDNMAHALKRYGARGFQDLGLTQRNAVMRLRVGFWTTARVARGAACQVIDRSWRGIRETAYRAEH